MPCIPLSSLFTLACKFFAMEINQTLRADVCQHSSKERMLVLTANKKSHN